MIAPIRNEIERRNPENWSKSKNRLMTAFVMFASGAYLWVMSKNALAAYGYWPENPWLAAGATYSVVVMALVPMMLIVLTGLYKVNQVEE